jgi:hypothetical protein
MPNWITLAHVLFLDEMFTKSELLLLAVSLACAGTCLITAMVAFAENAGDNGSENRRCENAKAGFLSLAATVGFLLLGNYGTILVGIVLLYYLFRIFFFVAKGMMRSLSACRR